MFTVGRALGLVLLGFILGVVVTGLRNGEVLKADRVSPNSSASNHAFSNDLERDYSQIARTDTWQVATPVSSNGNQLAIFQHGKLRINIVDDTSALHITTHKNGNAAWEGRLMDVGNDGTIEVADITNGRCEKF